MIKSAKAGDIIVVPKMNETQTGDTLSVSGELEVDPLPMPVPLYPVAIQAKNKKDEDKLGTFLSKQAEIDQLSGLFAMMKPISLLFSLWEICRLMCCSIVCKNRLISMSSLFLFAFLIEKPFKKPRKRKDAIRSKRVARVSLVIAG